MREKRTLGGGGWDGWRGAMCLATLAQVPTLTSGSSLGALLSPPRGGTLSFGRELCAELYPAAGLTLHQQDPQNLQQKQVFSNSHIVPRICGLIWLWVLAGSRRQVILTETPLVILWSPVYLRCPPHPCMAAALPRSVRQQQTWVCAPRTSAARCRWGSRQTGRLQSLRSQMFLPEWFPVCLPALVWRPCGSLSLGVQTTQFPN